MATPLPVQRTAAAEQIAVTHRQGSTHAFLLLKTADGRVIGHGDMVSTAQGDQVHSRLTYHFRDGSVDDETTVFEQRKTFQLIQDHHVQKGPSFPKPLDLSFVRTTGTVVSHEWKDGADQVSAVHMDLPPDVANGLTTAVLQNISANTGETRVAYLAGAPKPRLVTLSIKPAGQERFSIGGAPHTANRYSIHIDLGGLVGVVAPLIGKQPNDVMVWVTAGEVQCFLKMEGALYLGGPIWTTELAALVWGGSK